VTLAPEPATKREVYRSIDADRGPFRSSADWLKSWLALIKFDIENPWLLNGPDSDSDSDREELELSRSVISLLLELMPKPFPPQSERFAFFHHDFSRQNPMV